MNTSGTALHSGGQDQMDEFWDGSEQSRTLPGAVQRFVWKYPHADEELRRHFARAVVQDQIIGRKVPSRKLMDLVEAEIAKVDPAEVTGGGTSEPTGKEADRLSILQADMLDGGSFQDFAARMLEKNGYTDIEVTGRSGDQGGDIVAAKDGQKIVIQAKRYSITRKVSNAAVQEAYSAVTYYDADIGAVITNTLYTRAAKELAEKTGIVLWDRRDLAGFIDVYNMASGQAGRQ